MKDGYGHWTDYCHCCGKWEALNIWCQCETCWHHWLEGQKNKCNPEAAGLEDELMPKKVERKLEAEARRKHLTGKRRAAYVYGTLARLKKKRKG